VKTTFIPGRIELDMDAELTLEEAMTEFQSRLHRRARGSGLAMQHPYKDFVVYLR
jgi:hypothetical protein